MATGDVWKVIFDMNWGTVECRPGLYLVEGTGGAGVDPAADVFDAVVAAIGGAPIDDFSDQLTWTGLIIEDIQPGTTPTKTFPFAAPITGSELDINPLPPQDSIVISFDTAVKPITGAYAAQGRMYMPGLPQNGQISGFLQAPIQVSAQAFAQLFGAAFIDDGTAYQWHVVSFTPNSKPRTIRAINPVTTFSVNNMVRAQRRRQPDRGI